MIMHCIHILSLSSPLLQLLAVNEVTLLLVNEVNEVTLLLECIHCTVCEAGWGGAEYFTGLKRGTNVSVFHVISFVLLLYFTLGTKELSTLIKI